MSRRARIAAVVTVLLILAGARAGMTGHDLFALLLGGLSWIAAACTLLLDGLDHEPPSRPGYPAERRNQRRTDP